MQVALSLRPGGLERVVIDLVNNSGADTRHVVCCLEDAGDWASQVCVPVFPLGKKPGLDWRLPWQLARLARQQRIDVIHTHNAAAHLYGALAGALAGVRVLHTEHGKNVGLEASAHRVNRFAARFTDFTVAVSEKNAEIAVAHEGARPDALAVVPNGIPVEAFARPVDRGSLRRELGVPADAKIIGTIGRLVREKNHALLLRAFAGLAASDASAHLVLAGDGPLRAELQQQAGERVHFLGQRSDVATLLGCFDAFVLSSSTEGMSMALLEAMAAGCPIVVTAVGGNVELIQNGQNGLVVPPDDDEALAIALARVLSESLEARRLGDNARAVAQRRYSVEQMARQYETLYRALVPNT